MAAGALFSLAQYAQCQTPVYDNTSAFNGNFNYNNAEAGNEVIVSGGATSNYISSFQVQFDLISSGANPFSGAPTGNEEVEVCFYDNDGAPVSGYSSPGTLIWSSGFSTMSAIGLTTFTEGNTLTYNPDIFVPKDFTWTMTFDNVPSGESAGMGLFSDPAGPSVGANFDDAWIDTGPSWQLDSTIPGYPGLQFGAILDTNSIPPATIGISLAGTNVVLNGVNGHAGATYYVLMSTNLALPLNQWWPIATNVLSTDGDFTITNTVTSTVPTGFFILQTQ